MPPTGRATNPIVYVLKASSVPVRGSAFGKKRRLKTSAAAVPYRKKSYHSIVVPMKLANATRRTEPDFVEWTEEAETDTRGDVITPGHSGQGIVLASGFPVPGSCSVQGSRFEVLGLGFWVRTLTRRRWPAAPGRLRPGTAHRRSRRTASARR